MHTNKIPKIIHYCWFGNNEKPELVKKCIESWKKYLPDYKIREWNNSDLQSCNVKYVLDAIKEKKWAFVSDYFRLYALFTEGGIYFDSDNEVFKSFDEFLDLDFFTGYEKYQKDIHSFTAVVGAKKGNHIIKDLLEEYNDASFYTKDGDLNLLTNTQRVENYFKNNYNWYFIKNEEKVHCRSGYEVIYANYLINNNINFEYEPKCFVLNKKSRYTPDFYLIDTDEWIEIKGSFKSNNQELQKEKIQVFKQTHKHKTIYWNDIVSICNLPYKAYKTYFRHADKNKIRIEDYLANLSFYN